MFENKVINDIHKSRYVASWTNSGGTLDRKGRLLFKKWLKSLIINNRPLTDDEVLDIFVYAQNGKMELEFSAEDFLKEEAKK